MRLPLMHGTLLLATLLRGGIAAPASDSPSLLIARSLDPRECVAASCPAERHLDYGTTGPGLRPRSAKPLGPIAQRIANKFKAAGDAIKGGFEKLGQKLEQKVAAPIEQKIIKPLETKVFQPVAGLAGKANGALKKAPEKLKEGFQKVGDGLKVFRDKMKQGLQKMGKELRHGGQLMNKYLNPKTRPKLLNDAQRAVMTSVFKTFGMLVGSIGCEAVKLIPGVGLAGDGVCAAAAAGSMAGDAAMKAKNEKNGMDENGLPKDAMKTAKEGATVGKDAAQLAKAGKAVSILGTVTKALRGMMAVPLPIKKRSLEGPLLEERSVSPQGIEWRTAVRRRAAAQLPRRRHLQRSQLRRRALERRRLAEKRLQTLESWRRQAERGSPARS